MANAARGILRFDVFELDLESLELRQRGQRVSLAPQAFRVLAMLASRPKQVLKREEIQKQIWNGTFVDFEHGINKAIRQIRASLGDDADAPRFVETLPRLGYRFVADVSQPDEGDAPPALVETAPSEPLPAIVVRPRARSIFLLAGVALVIIGAVSAGWRGRILATIAGDPIRSLAVLPLENLSGDAAEDYFADGITEELTTDLARTGDLRVISHTSAMKFKNSGKTLPEIGRELNVDAAVEGAVMRSGNRTRITVQLIRTRTDAHLWADTWDQDLGEVLAIPEAVTLGIASRIRTRLNAPGLPGGSPRVVSPAVRDAWLKGRYQWNKRTRDGLELSLRYFEEAVAKDTGYAAAYAGMADAYSTLGAAGYDVLPESEAMKKARASAERALQLDDTLSGAHASLAFVAYSYDWDWKRAERELKRALELDPNNATAHQWYSEYLTIRGRWSQATAQAEAALALDPLSPIIRENRSRPYYYSHDFERAITYSKKALAEDPDFAISHMRLGRAYAAESRYAEAATEFQRFSDLSAGSTLAIASLANLRARQGDRNEALRLLGELHGIAARKYVPAYQFALVYAGLGDSEHTLQSLQKAYEERADYLLYLKSDPLFDNLRKEQRFRELERAIGLDP
jgi:TolB-like protein/DNA-binding winged helix-turn-helix (wHTH) protein/tetratricopeptide (TPR) repeat protein